MILPYFSLIVKERGECFVDRGLQFVHLLSDGLITASRRTLAERSSSWASGGICGASDSVKWCIEGRGQFPKVQI